MPKRESSANLIVTKTPSEVQLADFKILRLIGQGSFGKVFLVQKKGINSKSYAMKVLRKDAVTSEA